MFLKIYTSILIFACWSADGLKSSEGSVQFDGNELKPMNNVSKINRTISLEKYSADEIVSNATLTDRTMLHLDELNIWNLHVLTKLWNRGSLNLSIDCEADMTNYMTGLSLGEEWALKMTDATGRYTWGLSSGNVFWVGAVDQCRDMEEQFIEWQKTKSKREENTPPFPVGMSSATVNLNVRRFTSNETYRIIFGLCLPDACGVDDVEKLLRLVEDQRRDDSSVRMTIGTIRNLSRGYSFWEDPIFHILSVAFVIVTVLVILGTLYDVSLRYRILQTEQTSSSMDNTTELKILNHAETADGKITMKKIWSVREHNGSSDVHNSNSAPRPFSEALLSFSLLLNLSKVFSLDVGADTLAPIHGLRFLSMLWIILVHTCLTVNVVSEIKTFKSKAENNFLYQTISNSTYSVDTFFFMSGCLVSFLYFRTITRDGMKKKKIIRGACGEVLQFLGMVWYRYFRLTPVYLLVIGLIEVTSSWYYDHTMLDLYALDYQNCRKFWWRNALYINTYFAMDERCIVWSWYLANDTLFYIIGTIILIVGARFLSTAAIITLCLLIGSWTTTVAVSLKLEHVVSVQDPFARYESLYDKPWSRIGPYLLGMMAGWYLYKTDCEMKISKTVASVLWLFSFVAMLSIVYGVYGNTFSPFVSALYTALSHSGWAVSIGWILIACVTGHGRLINKILSWPGLYPLSRLSYCAYLVHPAIIRAVVLHGESSIHLTRGLMAILFLGFTVATYAASLIISLLFEAPVVSLLRIVHPLRKWKKAK
ncbi:nose resistant to fluoxetine protein 6 isoform X2 [Ceratina calcarata]|uniref:Nose resistant to fluoxetine protein 6 isoform X2 n=1 Tax=Ceratina calcarata TaxID=156304 RepID=A0AAJ7S209_9HYME|nr:nose resistant to fluoxetine protein 6 isoform X2 [Ceratina calcarata]